jgi:hypothetical protein
MTTTTSAAIAVQARAVAQVALVQAFPVKGAEGAAIHTLRLDAAGVVGDRSHAVLDSTEDVVTAEHAPALRDVVAGLEPDGTPYLDVPGVGTRLTGRAADTALSTHLGRPVRLASVPVGSQLDAPVHLVSLQAVEAALRGEHEQAGCACSLSEPRANIVVDLAGAGREDGWIGRRLRAGEVLLRVSRKPGHCLGVYAEVLVAGTLRAGDQVYLVDEQHRDEQHRDERHPTAPAGR